MARDADKPPRNADPALGVYVRAVLKQLEPAREQRDLAAALPIDDGQLSRILNGKAGLPLDFIPKIAAFLNKPEVEVLRWATGRGLEPLVSDSGPLTREEIERLIDERIDARLARLQASALEVVAEHARGSLVPVMIRCPETGDDSYTGVSVSAEAWASQALGITENGFRCEICHKWHTWTGRDAYVRPGTAPAPTSTPGSGT